MNRIQTERCAGRIVGITSDNALGLQIAIDEAELLMNRVAAGEGQWDDIRGELAECYTKGGQQVVADFIRAAI